MKNTITCDYCKYVQITQKLNNKAIGILCIPKTTLVKVECKLHNVDINKEIFMNNDRTQPTCKDFDFGRPINETITIA